MTPEHVAFLRSRRVSLAQLQQVQCSVTYVHIRTMPCFALGEGEVPAMPEETMFDKTSVDC